MRWRRRPDPELVRHTLHGTGPEVANTYGEEIMRLRKAMQRAVSELYADDPDSARRLLSEALAENWWK